jgi:hypothetical protein
VRDRIGLGLGSCLDDVKTRSYGWMNRLGSYLVLCMSFGLQK